jgi:hypothetical protein
MSTVTHEFYAEHRGRARGLTFPGNEPPDYWDFLYFSFVIGMTFAGVGCRRDVQAAQENRNRSRSALLHLQCGSARAGDQLSRNRYRQSSRLLKSCYLR